MQRTRLDTLLVRRGYFASRERARSAVMAGLVLVDGRRETRPGTRVGDDAVVDVKTDPVPYVSRGGLKLAGALDAFGLDVTGLVALDVGASTGGFTECLLRRGAKRVYAVDVGYGQLAWRLRSDPRVVVMERTNARYLKPGDVPEPVDLATIDVAFISLLKVLGPVRALLAPQASVLALVKPQFEAGRGRVGKKGVVRDPAVHQEVLASVMAGAAREDLYPGGITYSPLRGPEGNIEFWLLLTTVRQEGDAGEGGGGSLPGLIAAVVQEAHRVL